MDKEWWLQSMGSEELWHNWDFTSQPDSSALEKKWQTHLQFPCWRIPGTQEPDAGLQSLGLTQSLTRLKNQAAAAASSIHTAMEPEMSGCCFSPWPWCHCLSRTLLCPLFTGPEEGCWTRGWKETSGTWNLRQFITPGCTERRAMASLPGWHSSLWASLTTAAAE